MLLIEMLEDYSLQLKSLHDTFADLRRDYNETLDRDLRREMDSVKKRIRKKERKLYEVLYENFQELILLKKKFPELYRVLLSDAYVGGTVARLDWLSGFRPMGRKVSAEELESIRKQRKGLADAVDFLKNWAGPIDGRSLMETWPVLKGQLEAEMDADEALKKISETDKELKRKGWLVILNEPLAGHYFRMFLEKLRSARMGESEKKAVYTASLGQGPISESESRAQYLKAKSEKEKYERFCRHFLSANPEFLRKLKSSKDLFVNYLPADVRFIESVSIHKINEAEWLERMKKLLG